MFEGSVRLARVRPGGWFVGLMLITAYFCALSSTAFGLSDARVYERVSPFYKGGYGVGAIRMVGPDDGRVSFDSLGVFGGVQWDTLESVYVAERVDGVGWSTGSLQPPPIAGIIDFSSDFGYVMAGGSTGKTKAGVEGPETGREYLLYRVDLPNVAANWEVFGGQVLTLVDDKPFDGVNLGSSGDLCHNILGHSGPLLPEADKTIEEIYDQSRGCDGEPYLRLIGVDNAGHVLNPSCEVELGLGSDVYDDEEPKSTFNTLSASGDMIFFTANAKKGSECGAGGHQLFVRLGGEATLEVSKPVSEGCVDVPCPGAAGRPSASFRGASEDGSRVFFTTHAPLVGDDVDDGNDLYLAVLGCGEGEASCGVAQQRVVSLTQVSRAPLMGQSADVVGVLRIAPDGSRIYFVARGVLSEGSNAKGDAPISGADNLYVYNAQTGDIKFITKLCSGPVLSGEAVDLACPSDLGSGRNDTGLWSGVQEVQSTRNGRVLVFSSYGQLTRDDADTARDVYRYDETSGSLLRVSVGEDGFDANGNSDGFDASIASAGINPGRPAHNRLELVSRAVSDDGLRIVFNSAGMLSPRVVNGHENVYEWYSEDGEDGVVSLLSGGASLTSDEDATISPSGRDVFFVTAQGLISGDTDGLRDVYDARIDGGFPAVPMPRQPCSGDACQGPLAIPTPLLVPASAVQAAGENFSPPAKKKAVKKKRKRRTAGGKRKKALKSGARSAIKGRAQ